MVNVLAVGLVAVAASAPVDEAVFTPQSEPPLLRRLPPLPEEDGKRHEVIVAAGMHYAAAPLPSLGASYRYSLHRHFSLRGGFEIGQAPMYSGGVATPTNLGKVTLALLTNQFLYVGCGASYSTSGPQSTFAYGGSLDAIAGLRLLFPTLVIGGEARWGLFGPSGVQFYTGYRF